MCRETLKPGTILELKRSNTQAYDVYTTYVIEGHPEQNGANKLVYFAKKQVISGDDDSDIYYETVILKEFFPKNMNISRGENGFVVLPDNDIVASKIEAFRREAEILGKYKMIPETSAYIAAPDDVCVLEGNGTYYIENTYYVNAVSWADLKNANELKADELLNTVIECNKFLAYMHKNSDALIDFKPTDVLIAVDPISGNYDTAHPLFYDFGSVLELDKEYNLSQVHFTDEFAPMIFKQNNEKVEINLRTERETFLNVCTKMFDKLKEKYVPKTWEKINKLWNVSVNGDLSDEEYGASLASCLILVQDEEHKHNKKKLKIVGILFTIAKNLLVVIVSALYLAIGYVLVNICINPDAVKSYVESIGLNTLYLAIILVGVSLIVIGLRILEDLASERIARIKTSINFKEKNLNTGDFNTFRRGWRKKTTYQSISKHHVKRQILRRFLWVALVVTLIASLIISIIIKNLPFFFAAACIILYAFMYTDALVATNDFFKLFDDEFLINNPSVSTGRIRKGSYFRAEYEMSAAASATGEALNNSSEYYTGLCRNAFTLKRDLLSKLKEDSKYELGYMPFQVRHMYAMNFDRLRNSQLIIDIVVFVVTIITVLMDFMVYSDYLQTFFRMPVRFHFSVTIVLLIATWGVSFWQIINSLNFEIKVAEASYKSRYVMKDSLNSILVEDICANRILPIDVVRGTDQTVASFNTVIPGMSSSEKRMLRRPPVLDRRLVHHEAIANQRRFSLTILFVAVFFFSIFVWYGQMFWLFPIILVLSIGIDLAYYFYFLEINERKKMTKNVEDYLKLKNQNKK